jgi:copper oxidase (laccase) domain-containing protein
VVVVERPGQHAGAEADAAVTTTPGCALVVRTADCAPVVLSGNRSVAVLHLGWRGLLADLVARTVEVMADLGDGPVAAELGACIRPGCYEFAGPELQDVTGRFGDGVRSSTTAGRPALDLPATVRAALAEVGIDHLEDRGGCTACDPRWYSHRGRREVERFATVAWIEAA